MDADLAALPDDIAALKAALALERARVRDVVAERDAGAAELAVARAKASEELALIAHQKLRIAKLERQLYGPRSERSERLIDQLALQFEELEASATEDELAAEIAVAKTTMVTGFTRRRRERNTFPDHLPRERVVIDPPTRCECCGGTRLRKLGEDVTQTLEVIPRQWKVIETVREKLTCRDCEKISQAPAPFHAIARGWAGPQFVGDDPVREVRPASALEPAGRALCSGRRADQPLDDGRCRRVELCGARSGAETRRGACHGGRTPAWRRYDRAGPGQRQDRYGAMLGLCA
jgi:transposase